MHSALRTLAYAVQREKVRATCGQEGTPGVGGDRIAIVAMCRATVGGRLAKQVVAFLVVLFYA